MLMKAVVVVKLGRAPTPEIHSSNPSHWHFLFAVNCTYLKEKKRPRMFRFLTSGRQCGSFLFVQTCFLFCFFKWAIPGHFFFIFLFSIHSWQKTNVQYINKFLLMTGFELRTSVIGSNGSTNWATTTPQHVSCLSLEIFCSLHASSR